MSVRVKCYIVLEVTQFEFGIRSLRTFCIFTIQLWYNICLLLACGSLLWKRFGPPKEKKVWARLSKTICQRHESKMLKVIKMSKTVPILCPGSVDIKSHIIESCWPPPSQGRCSQPFTLHTVKLIRSSSHTEPWRTYDPFYPIPSLTAYVFPC